MISKRIFDSRMIKCLELYSPYLTKHQYWYAKGKGTPAKEYPPILFIKAAAVIIQVMFL